MKVVFCVPTIKRPYQQCLDSLEASLPLLNAAGIEHAMVNEVGNPYISAARATMLRKALTLRLMRWCSLTTICRGGLRTC